MRAYWIASLSNGVTAIEHKGDFVIKEGERKPWIRLCEKLTNEGLHITALRIRVGKRTFHLPRLSNHKFPSIPPQYYSLCYHLEVDDLLGERKERHYIDIAAHYSNFAVHFIHDMAEGRNGYITVTENTALAPSPKVS